MPSKIEEIQQNMATGFDLNEDEQNDITDKKCLKLRKNYRPTAEFARFMRLSEVTIFRRRIFVFYIKYK